MRTFSLVILIVAASFAACDDDPAAPCDCPEQSPWVEVDLGTEPGQGARLTSIDCEGADCVAGGFAVAQTPRGDVLPGYQMLFFARDGNGDWQPATFPGLPEENHFDLALAASGAAVIVGYGLGEAQSIYATIYDGRTPEPTTLSPGSGGLLTVDGSGDFFVAGGMAGTAHLSSSQSPGSWNLDGFPSSGRNDRGFQDVHVNGDVAVACGFDDGADTLQVVLQRTRSSGWEMVNRNGLEFAVALRCIAIADDGTIYLGGVQAPGGPDSRAWASVRDLAGTWTALDLPGAVELGRVNDILLANDGSVYFACSSEYEDSNTAHLLRMTGQEVQPEIAAFPGSLLQLSEADDGTIYAAGSRRAGTGQEREPVLLQRDR